MDFFAIFSSTQVELCFKIFESVPFKGLLISTFGFLPSDQVLLRKKKSILSKKKWKR